jgi:hypothetical protein
MLGEASSCDAKGDKVELSFGSGDPAVSWKGIKDVNEIMNFV